MSAPEHSRADEVRAAIATLRSSASTLQLTAAEPARGQSWSSSAVAAQTTVRSDSPRVIAALQKAALILSDAREPMALELRRELQQETGLSMPMIEWGLVTSLSSLRHAPLVELVSAIPADAPRELIGVVLAGNVFVAAVRGLALPLLAGAHVIAKTATREGAFARAFQAALSQADPAVGARLFIVQFSREDEQATRALCQGADALSVYGSDETVEQLRQLCAAPTGHSEAQGTRRNAKSTRVIAHGHGLSAAYVARSALASPEHAARTAERVALDISAYDQHGCLSPHFVLVENGAAVEPQAFAQLLAAHAMPVLAQVLPPAEPSISERAEQLQWQAIAAVRGELYAHTTHAVSFEPAPLRPSPGGRHVSVYACGDNDQLRALLGPFAEHLKSVGFAGTRDERQRIAEQLQRFTSAQVCRSGEMQTPPFDAWADGAPPLAGLIRQAIR